MKLINLKFRNLNALKGDWHIDFTDPAFTQNGIFAIIGDTGAGKTTILDAICLALYGKTPRLGKITASHNDIMNVQSGDCSSEVIIETAGKHYHFSFLQRRARNSPQGKLQDPKREIRETNSKGDETKPLATKIDQVEKLGIEILGMDFNQFTRSVMLAQGEFNKFLSAEPEERGELLEKITGTQIYSKIGVLAFQTHKAKKEALDQAITRLHDIKTLSDDELSTLNASYAQNLAQKDTLANEQKTLSHQLALITDFIKTNEKLGTLNHQAHLAKQSLDDFERTHPTLDNAQKAQSLNGDFATLTAVKTALKDSQARLHDLTAALPKLDIAYQKSQAKLEACQKNLDSAKNQKTQSLPIINQVQHLEKTLGKLDSDHQHKQNELNTLNHALQQKHTSHTQAQEKLSQTQASLDQGETALAQTKNLETLDGDVYDTLSQWQDSLTGLLTHLSDLKNEHTIVGQLRQDLEQKTQALCQSKATLDDANTALNKSTQKLTQLCQLATFDQDSLSTHINNAQTTLQSQQEQKTALSELINRLQQSQSLAELSANKEAQKAQHANIKTSQAHLDQCQERLDSASRLYEQSQKNHELILQLHALQSHLDALTDGTPCPLCGSLSHPNKAQKHDQSELDHSTQTIKSQKISLDKHQNDHAQALITLNNQQNALTALQDEFAKLHHRYEQDLAKEHSLWQNLVPFFSRFDALPDLTHAIDGHFGQLKEHLSIINDNNIDNATNDGTVFINNLINKLDKLKNNISLSIDEQKRTLDTLYQENQTYQHHRQTQLACDHAYALALSKHSHTTHTLNQHKTKTKTIIDALAQKLNTLSTLNHTLTPTLTPILSTLAPALLTLWNTHSTHIYALHALGKPTSETLGDFYAHNDALTNLNTPPLYGEVLTCLKQLATAQKDRQAKQHTQATLKLTLDALNNELSTLNQDIARLNDDIHACQTALNTLTNAQNQCVNERTQLIGNASLHDFEHSLDQAILTAQNAFDTAKDDHAQAKSNLDTQHRLIKDESDRRHSHEHRLTTLNTAFENALMAQGFASFDDYDNAKMDDGTLTTLLATKDELTHAHKLLNSQLNAIKDEQLTLAKRHQDDFGTDITTADIEKLEQQKHALDTALEALIGTLGADGEKLAHAQKTLAQKHALQQDISTAQNDLRVWQYLNKLIGCGTGKTYRNYVQALSLNVLLAHANQILHKISDRYTLIQGQDKPSEKSSDTPQAPKATLGIEVIDHYQGNQIRSSKNLSGGESFIASLALALGLSSLNSQKVHIESLFLDEGFGTLDEDALDIALGALSKIEQSGKTIGIISHVHALKERISTQIIAQKHSGGVSSLTGAGVARG